MPSVNVGDIGTLLGDITGGGDFGGDLNAIAQRNLDQAAAQNIQIPVPNPNAVPAPGATASVPASTRMVNTFISNNTKWLVGGAFLVILFLAMKKKG